MDTLLLALALAGPAHADPVPPLRGDTVTAGSSPVQLRLSSADPGEALAELWWHAFDRVTIAQIVPVGTVCDAADLAGGRARVAEVGGCVDTRVDSPHPTYAYTERDRLRCVIGRDDRGAIAACKLPFTGWFDLRPFDPAG